MELDNRYIGAHLCIKISTFAEEIVAKQDMDVQSKLAASQEACLPNAHSLIIFVRILRQRRILLKTAPELSISNNLVPSREHVLLVLRLFSNESLAVEKHGSHKELWF